MKLYTAKEKCIHEPPSEMCPATFTDLAAFQRSAEQSDDMTMLIAGIELGEAR